MSSSVADRTDELMPDAVLEGLSRSLFDRVGGTAGVNLIVDNLLERLLSDAELAARLAATDVASLKQSQAAFFEAAFGGRATDSQTARLEVDADELVRVWLHVCDTLTNLDLSAAVADELVLAVADRAFAADRFTRRR